MKVWLLKNNQKIVYSTFMMSGLRNLEKKKDNQKITEKKNIPALHTSSFTENFFTRFSVGVINFDISKNRNWGREVYKNM